MKQGAKSKKGSSTVLPAIYSVAEGPGATGIRKISTPWPLIVGKAVFSIFLWWTGNRDSGSSNVPEHLRFAAKYLTNVIFSLGAMGFLISDLAHGGIFPSIGVMLTFENFFTLRYPLKGEARTLGQYQVRGMACW